jgi:hypothetical protein
MIAPEIMMALLEVGAFRPPIGRSSSGRPYVPLIDRLIRWLLIFNLPPLFFATIGVDVFLSGTAPAWVGLTELAVILLIAGTTVSLYRRLRKIQRLSRINYDGQLDSWLPTLQVDDLIDERLRAATGRVILALIPFAAIAVSPSAIIQTTQALHLIQYFAPNRRRWRTAQILRALHLGLLLVYTTFLAAGLLSNINRP